MPINGEDPVAATFAAVCKTILTFFKNCESKERANHREGYFGSRSGIYGGRARPLVHFGGNCGNAFVCVCAPVPPLATTLEWVVCVIFSASFFFFCLVALLPIPTT